MSRRFDIEGLVRKREYELNNTEIDGCNMWAEQDGIDQNLADERRSVLDMASEVHMMLKKQNVRSEVDLSESYHVQPDPKRGIIDRIRRKFPDIESSKITHRGWVLPIGLYPETQFRDRSKFSIQPYGPWGGMTLVLSAIECTVLTDDCKILNLTVDENVRGDYIRGNRGGSLKYFEAKPLKELFTHDDFRNVENANDEPTHIVPDFGPLGRLANNQARWREEYLNRVAKNGLLDLCIKYGLISNVSDKP